MSWPTVLGGGVFLTHLQKTKHNLPQLLSLHRHTIINGLVATIENDVSLYVGVKGRYTIDNDIMGITDSACCLYRTAIAIGHQSHQSFSIIFMSPVSPWDCLQNCCKDCSRSDYAQSLSRPTVRCGNDAISPSSET
jgi:hypothetical protein